MDNHPIPQDVTNFQFRLIGEMTLKQFGYVVAGVVFAWVALASPLFILLKMLFAGLCIMAGVVLAFVPYEGRPADLMILYFIKALFNPTQFIYQKLSQSVNPLSQQKVMTPPPVEEQQKEEKNQQVETVTIQSLPQIAVPAAQTHHEEPVQESSVQQETTTPATSTPIVQETALQQQVATLTQALTQAKATEEHQQEGSVAATAAHEKVTDLEGQLQEIMQQKQALEEQLVELQKTLSAKKEPVFTPTTAQAPAQETQRVKKIPKQMATAVGTPFVPDVPNLITGIIKDSRGNVLPNILIEVKDKDGNPVRAFKTNPLGQFASATPLLSGTYTISFEDPQGKHSFDAVEITANGEVLLPFEIISIDARERLRQELFGS